MTTSYEELEQALNNAYTQVQNMSGIIGVLLEETFKEFGVSELTITREELRNNYKDFIVIVTPNENSIILTLKAK